MSEMKDEQTKDSKEVKLLNGKFKGRSRDCYGGERRTEKRK